MVKRGLEGVEVFVYVTPGCGVPLLSQSREMVDASHAEGLPYDKTAPLKPPKGSPDL